MWLEITVNEGGCRSGFRQMEYGGFYDQRAWKTVYFSDCIWNGHIAKWSYKREHKVFL